MRFAPLRPSLFSARRIQSFHFHFRFIRLAPIAIVALLFVLNIPGLLSSALAPTAASAASAVEIIPLDIPASGDCDLDWIIFRAGEREGVDPRFIHAVIKQESNYKQNAQSTAGARGVMQLMPETAKRFGVTDLDNMTANVDAGTKYLAWLLKR